MFKNSKFLLSLLCLSSLVLTVSCSSGNSDNISQNVAFGTKKLFGAQFRLDKNSYKNHQEWLKEWQQSRSHIVYYEGAAIIS